MMADHLIYVKITGEPFLSRARAYREACFACHEAWEAFRKEKGADGIPGGYSGGLLFNRSSPDGWTKPKGKLGFSYPKRGHEDAARISALPSRPRTFDVFGDTVIHRISYETARGSGSGVISYQWEPYILWVGDEFYARIPDAKSAANEHPYRDEPGFRITNGASTWTLPEGLERVSEARVDLAIALHNLALEEAA
jgi:hypothetical protein